MQNSFYHGLYRNWITKTFKHFLIKRYINYHLGLSNSFFFCLSFFLNKSKFTYCLKIKQYRACTISHINVPLDHHPATEQWSSRLSSVGSSYRVARESSWNESFKRYRVVGESLQFLLQCVYNIAQFFMLLFSDSSDLVLCTDPWFLQEYNDLGSGNTVNFIIQLVTWCLLCLLFTFSFVHSLWASLLYYTLNSLSSHNSFTTGFSINQFFSFLDVTCW